MPTKLSFVAAASFGGLAENLNPNQGLTIIGTKASVSAALDSLGTQVTNDVAFLKEILEGTSVSDFAGGKNSAFVKGTINGITKVGFLLVPTNNSRHNSPHRADVVANGIADLVKPHSTVKNAVSRTQVVLALSGEHAVKDAALATVCAIARAFPTYTRKENAKETASELELQISLFHSSGQRFVSSDDVGQPLDAFLLRLNAAAKAVRQTAAYVDMPCNELHAGTFVEEARRIAQGLHNVSIEVVQGEELQERGFGGIYGVGKAATNPPALVILKYSPSQPTRTVVWVGKGIVYDTGGLCIKSRDGMCGMKMDMGGAAAILSAFEAAASTGFPDTLYALLCIAENAVGPLATRPDDIHTLYSGKTVEINNTDAEGRLVLADGVAYASKHLSPDVILDMATLTGAQGIATGALHAAVLCNDEEWEARTVAAGKASGDLTYPVLFCPELLVQEFRSEVADFKNSVKSRMNAQTSCAGHFIGSNLVDYSKPWIHVDMAGPAHKGDRATGYGAALLLKLFHY
eukprot:Colp12_sorted_trinity150504_noHs@1533